MDIGTLIVVLRQAMVLSQQSLAQMARAIDMLERHYTHPVQAPIAALSSTAAPVYGPVFAQATAQVLETETPSARAFWNEVEASERSTTAQAAGPSSESPPRMTAEEWSAQFADRPPPPPMPYTPLPTLTFERIPIPVIPPERRGFDGNKTTADKWCICSDIEACDRFYVTEANWMAKKGCYHVMRQCRGLDRAHHVTDIPQCRVLEEKLQACSVCIALGHEPGMPGEDPGRGNVPWDRVGRQCRCPAGHTCTYYAVTVGN